MSSAMEQTFEAACMEREIPGAVLLAEDQRGMLLHQFPEQSSPWLTLPSRQFSLFQDLWNPLPQCRRAYFSG